MFNPIATMLTTSYSPTSYSPGQSHMDNFWYMNSGLEQHFPQDFGNMIDASVYYGEEQSMVGNIGKIIGTSHIGIILCCLVLLNLFT